MTVLNSMFDLVNYKVNQKVGLTYEIEMNNIKIRLCAWSKNKLKHFHHLRRSYLKQKSTKELRMISRGFHHIKRINDTEKKKRRLMKCMKKDWQIFLKAFTGIMFKIAPKFSTVTKQFQHKCQLPIHLCLLLFNRELLQEREPVTNTPISKGQMSTKLKYLTTTNVS